MDLNYITKTCLEVIFIAFVVQILAKSLLGIDILRTIHKIWCKMMNKMLRDDDDSTK